VLTAVENSLCDDRVPTVDGFLDFLAENSEISRHKWLESEKVGFDVGVDHALSSWMAGHRADWLQCREQIHDARCHLGSSSILSSSVRLGVTLSLPDRQSLWPESYMADLDAACRNASELGYDGVELAIPEIGQDAFTQIQRARAEYNIDIAALTTSAGWIAHGLNLVNPSPLVRNRAIDFAGQMIGIAAPIGAPVIVSSWIETHHGLLDDPAAAGWLADGLLVLSEFGEKNGVRILFEPLSRGGVVGSGLLEHAQHLLETLGSDNIGLVANQHSVSDVTGELPRIEYVRYVADAGESSECRHLRFAVLSEFLERIGYGGFLAVECLPSRGSRC